MTTDWSHPGVMANTRRFSSEAERCARRFTHASKSVDIAGCVRSTRSKSTLSSAATPFTRDSSMTAAGSSSSVFTSTAVIPQVRKAFR